MKLIAYLSNGYPTLEESNARGKFFIQHGIDILEADFPGSDPYLDSEYLQRRIFAALKNESNYDKYMEMLIKLKVETPGVQYLINIYEYTIREIGVEKFIRFMHNINQSQVLLIGKTDPDVRKALKENQLYVSSYVTRGMLSEDLELASNSNGFVYMQGFGDEKEYSNEYPTLKDCVTKVREVIGSDRPIYVGVGLHTFERVVQVQQSGADGAFLGSIVLRKEDSGEDMSEYLSKLRKIADGK
jgi:tryptophan synthase alpha chain